MPTSLYHTKILLRVILLAECTQEHFNADGLLFLSEEVDFFTDKDSLIEIFVHFIIENAFGYSKINNWGDFWQQEGLFTAQGLQVLAKSQSRKTVFERIFIQNRNRRLNRDILVDLTAIIPNTGQYDHNSTFVQNALSLSKSVKWSGLTSMIRNYMDATKPGFVSQLLANDNFSNLIFEEKSFPKIENQNLVSLVEKWTKPIAAFIQVDESLSSGITLQKFQIQATYSNGMMTPDLEIPIIYSMSDRVRRPLMLDSNEIVELNIDQPYILIEPNANCRVLYSYAMTGIIIKSIEVKRDLDERNAFMSPLQRAVLVSDMFYFTRSGLADYEQLVRLTSSLLVENDTSIWIATIDGFDWIRKVLSHSYDTRESQWLNQFVTTKLYSALARSQSQSARLNFVKLVGLNKQEFQKTVDRKYCCIWSHYKRNSKDRT